MQAAISPEVKKPENKKAFPPRTPTLEHHGDVLEDDDGSHISKPSDFNCTAYVLMTILGLGLLMPWNIVLLALDYFTEEYPGSGISFFLSVAYIYPQLPMLGVVMVVGENFSFGARILSTFIGQAVVLVLLPFYAHYGVWVTIGTVLFIGVCTSIQQPSLFGLSSLYPQIYNTGLMSGQGVAGILASILRIVTKIALPTQHKESAIIYFITAGVVLLVCSACYLWLVSMPFSRRFLQEVEDRRAAEEDKGKERAAKGTAVQAGSRAKSPMASPLLEGEGEREAGEAGAAGAGSSRRRSQLGSARQSSALDSPGGFSMQEYKERERDMEGDDDVPGEGGLDGVAALPPASASAPRQPTEANALLGAGGEQGQEQGEDSSCGGRLTALLRVSKVVWPMMFAIGFVFTATFFVFPGEVVAVKYEGTVGLPGLSKADWWPVVLLTAFQIGDTTGRSLPAVLTCVSRQMLPWASLARVVFVPLWIVAARALPVVSSDPWTLVLMLVFALSNGYVSTLAFAYAPRMVDPVDREKVGFLMGLILQVGIASGSALSLALK